MYYEYIKEIFSVKNLYTHYYYNTFIHYFQHIM